MRPLQARNDGTEASEDADGDSEERPSTNEAEVSAQTRGTAGRGGGAGARRAALGSGRGTGLAGRRGLDGVAAGGAPGLRGGRGTGGAATGCADGRCGCVQVSRGEGPAVGRRRRPDGGQGHNGGGLLVGRDDTISAGEDTDGVHVVTVADLEDVRSVSSGGDEVAASQIKDVVAELLGVGDRRVTDLEAELLRAHEVVPFDDLLEGVVVAVVGGEGVRVDQATERVATLVSTVGVHFTTAIGLVDVDVLLEKGTSNENVGGGLEELDTGQGSSGHGTGAVARLGAPGNSLSLLVADEAVRVGRAPKAEVVKRVDHRQLAVGGLALSRGVALGVTELGTTPSVVGIDLVRNLTRILVNPVGERLDLSEGRGGEGGEQSKRKNVARHWKG